MPTMIEWESMKASALFFAEMGCSVIPLQPRDKVPCGALLKNGWKEFQDRRAAPWEIEEWFRANPNINIGLVCGQISRVAVIDVDGPNGQKWFKEHVSPKASPNLFQFTSGPTKFHAIYGHPMDCRIAPSVKALNEEIDIRGDGSYIALAPSVHPSGVTYRLYKTETYEDFQKLTPFPTFILDGDGNEARRPSGAVSAYVPSSRLIGGGEKVREGSRNDTLASMCGSWFAKRLNVEDVLTLALAWNAGHCEPPLPEREVEQTVLSMYNTHDGHNPLLFNTGGVGRWVANQQGEFSLDEVYNDLSAKVESDKQVVQLDINTLLADGAIERVGRSARRYRVVDREDDTIDIMQEAEKPIDYFWLPFRLHEMCRIYPKNIIVVAGETNSGKTGLLFNIVWQNMAQHRIKYLTSEMTAEEIRNRAMKFGGDLSLWREHVRFVSRARDYEDAIDPEGVNVVDYLEVYEDFSKIGTPIKKIFDKLTTGIAIICIQKKRGEMLGRGGDFTLEKARLGISLFTHGHLPNAIVGSALVTKCKHFVNGRNPDGKEIFYTMSDGFCYTPGVQGLPSIRNTFAYWNEKDRSETVREIYDHCRAISNAREEPQADFYDV